MSAATLTGPLVSLALPEGRNARLIAQMALVLAGTGLLTLAAKITVPFWPVPMTLQTLAIFLIAAAYGRNLAVATLLAYLVEGAVGLPVFASGGGLAYLAGPTGGYLAGFVVAAAIVGHAADRGLDRKAFVLFGAMMLGEVVILVLGAAWLAVLMGAEKAMTFGVGPFIVTDVVKIALAAAAVGATRSLLKRA
ncbi:biotin transporter BioY [Mesorhizobium sp. NBSH29]|uniref:biotin transporter BioY n=1 Tax=Mesorhizobium sp. NBSH29 TaxID=2654249 RepID=UPI0018967D1A|nr:biotin transporter BioY [Mesorhizobium sp. NBSH29]QPC87055.1 biotin transporter BioY [Mesorhizobium sp. NBSH29]